MQLSLNQLQEIRAALAARIETGLSRAGTEIAALPAYLAPPPIDASGTAVVVDAGGTNVRAAVVEVASGGRSRLLAGPASAKLSGGPEVTAAEFFEAQATLVERLGARPGLPVGYCFSYPSEILPSLDARLLRWTKGIQIAGVEGTCVGAQLGQALERRGLKPGPVRVLNDTVASLLGGALAHGGERPEALIGLIAGTGTNMAAFLPPARIPKLDAHDKRIGAYVAVNFESGNFNPPHLLEVDAKVDARSENPGAQRFEKAAAGVYLPRLFAELCPGEPPLSSSADLVRLRDEGAGDTQRIAGELLGRSADLVAAALAAVTDVLKAHGRVGVLAEGSLFWGDPQFPGRVRDTWQRLLGQLAEPQIHRLEHANLIGSACAALFA